MTLSTNSSYRFIGIWLLKLIGGLLVGYPFIWANHVLGISYIWSALIIAAIFAATINDASWERLLPLKPKWARLIVFDLLLLFAVVTQWQAVKAHTVMTSWMVVVFLILWGLSIAYHQQGAAANIAAAAFGILIAFILLNVGARFILNRLEQAAIAAQPPTPTPEPTATSGPAPTATSIPPTPTPAPTADPAIPTPMPEPERPIAGYGFLDWVVDNGEAEWTYRTAYGPRVNSTAHAYMYDAEGNFVYDTIVEYNGKGYRGPEAEYEKPAGTYRILIIGDSFVEAIQVPFEETFYAQLQTSLANETIDGKQIELIPMGRTGWGTYHEAAYYQVEGNRYDADLVIVMFYINDVADNFPTFFYPNINNTNYEFLVEDGTVNIVDTNLESLPPNAARLLYNALPSPLQNLGIAQLIVRIGDPAQPVQTQGGPMTRMHPQFYIYVSDPPVEGYADGWDRTAEAYEILSNEVVDDGAEFVVMPIFLGEEMVANVSGWFPDLVSGWEWDAGLPETRLAEILADQPAEMVPLRPYFEQYASDAGGEVYNLIYLPEDGHFNALGHEWTYRGMMSWLGDAKLDR